MSKNYVALYHQIGRLIEDAPDLTTVEACASANALRWLGMGHALVKEVNVGGGFDAIQFSAAVNQLTDITYVIAVRNIFSILYRSLAHCEIKLPVGTSGAFIPVGNSFDAFAALAKIFSSARESILICDPYMDETTLTEFALAIQEGVMLRLLSDKKSYKPTLKPAAQKWIEQYGRNRPIEIRLAETKQLHDRVIIVDGREAWTITQSLKDFAKRSPAEIIRVDAIAQLKIEAYEAIWEDSTLFNL
ncbi:phospholipase D-like domain-containing protein [Methylomonas koyamae]|uniref:phospholipase D-like domain-containing protein n=1 Tax=Methylomonas koyamae TaxID=702114 RepID=UPI002872ECB1|nr:phospholipase D-like domain-containing protein [Methylomonas koyamae]WNB77007.1 phospholipase D-like domain-containing protein [Methylomonas koyamae]